ncbi:MAG: DUF86 domain-containing protein [Deltaproteobacteria bacterium]|nr:DUF86 domain-containing protein [Deltaproteobacteria bacterium]
MPPRDWRTRCEDILEAVRRIARSVPPDVEARHPDLPWMEMRGLRNLVVHEYFGVDVAILWQTVRDDLPRLVPLLERALQE